MNIKYYLIFAISLLSSWNIYSAVNFNPTAAELLNPKAYLLNFNTSYFNTSGYFDDQGAANSLADGDGFKMLNTRAYIGYGIRKHLEIGVEVRGRNVSSSSGVNNLTKTGLESGAIYFKYGLPDTGRLKSAIGVHYRQTLYTNLKYDPPQIAPVDDLVLGDDGSEYSIGYFATFFSDSLKYVGNFSYQSPPNNLSAEIVYKLEAQYLFTSLTLLAGIDGIWSLKNDAYDAQTKPQISVGATHLFNSINREMIAPYFGLNYAFNKFSVGLLAQSVVKGKSTDSGSMLLISLSTATGGDTPEAEKIKSFKEYHIDGSVLKISARGNFLKIDQGISSDVEKGMRFDIFQTDYFGGNVLVASGIVVEVGSDWSNIKLVKKFSDIEIKPGFAARGL